jgi:hypothetical protein
MSYVTAAGLVLTEQGMMHGFRRHHLDPRRRQPIPVQ